MMFCKCVFFLFCGIDCFCFMMYVMENKIFDIFIVYYWYKNLYKVND